MKLLLRVDYNRLLVLNGSNVNVGAFLSALGDASFVVEEGYGDSRQLVPAPNTGGGFELTSLPDDSPLFQGSAAALAKARTENTKLTTKVWELEQKLKAATV